jgi:hypothetical protein
MADEHSAPSIEQIEERMALDDYTGALELAKARKSALPDDDEAAALVEQCQQELEQRYAQSLGGLQKPLRVLMSGDEMQWLMIDHRAGFLVSRIDGSITGEELLDVSSMPRFEALRILHELLQQKVIEVVAGG